MTENPILQYQKLTVLQQIDELKNWHKQQQLKSNFKTSPFEKNDFADEGNKIQKHGNNNSKYALNSDIKKHPQCNKASVESFDDIPIRGVQSNIDATSVNSNPTLDNQALHTNNNTRKQKFRFLRKGEGIARFRMGPVKIQKNKSGNRLNLQPLNSGKTSDQNNGKQLLDLGSNFAKERLPLLQPPDLKLDFKNWKSVFDEGNAIQIIEHAIDNNQLDIFQPNSSIDSSTASIMERLLTLGRKHLKDREEMRVFETMEQHILDSSFCSTSSYVTKLMENAVMSTPDKTPYPGSEKSNHIESQELSHRALKEEAKEERSKVDQKIVEEHNKMRETPVWTKECKEDNESNKLSSDSISSNLEQSLHVRFNEEVDYNSFIECSRSIGNSKENDNKMFKDSEEWKEDSSEESICCSQCGSEVSLDEDATPNNHSAKPPLLVNNDQVKGKRQIATQTSKQNSPVEKLDIKDLTTAKPHISESDLEDNRLSPVLNTKVKELENEIEAFRVENNKLKLIREKLEKEHKQFLLEKKRFLKEVEEEKKKNSTQLEEEKKKLAKEKLVFEKYSKSLTNKPSREEKKEMQVLREQLSEMKEELNKKESRWGAAQARVRNQVKLLEEDNKKLREEVEALRKQSKSLQILTQKKNKRPLSNTKLIHTINDHLSTIGPVSDENAFLDCGYFNPHGDGVKTVHIEDVDPKSVRTVKVVKENLQNNRSPTYNDVQNNSAQLQKKRNVNSDEISQKNDILSPELVSNDQRVSYRNSGSSEEVAFQEPDTKSKSPLVEDVSTNVIQEMINKDGSIEKMYPDGKKEIRFKNGNIKKIDPINGSEKTIYFNGDVKEFTNNGTIKYYFSESRIWHTTLPDGLEVLDFPDGQVEKRHTNGTVEIIYPSDCRKITYPDGMEEIFYSDGTNIKIEGNKRKVLSLPNGQKEIHTDECIQREYPDGTVKKVYPDGTTQTVYSNGRVRLKDKHGNLVMDSGNSAPVK